MEFDAGKETARLWQDLHRAQDEIGRMYYRWRRAALQAAGPEADPTDVSVKAAEVIGEEIGRSLLPRLDWLKGEQAWLAGLARAIAANWTCHGAVVTVEKGQGEFEVHLKWTRCPWPTHARTHGAGMEEDVLCCDAILRALLRDVNLFFDVDYRIETLSAIPRGQGACVRRLYKHTGGDT